MFLSYCSFKSKNIKSVNFYNLPFGDLGDLTLKSLIIRLGKEEFLR